MTLTAKLTYTALRNILQGTEPFPLPKDYRVVDVYQDYTDEKFIVTIHKDEPQKNETAK